MKNLIILFFILLFFGSCNTNEDKNDSTSKLLALLALNSNTSSTSSTTTTYTCTVTKKFTDVQASSTYSTCTSCHKPPNASASYDFTTYANAINSNGGNQVVSGSPSSSRLWRKIAPGGSMNGNSTTAFNELVYCWIEKGAAQ